MKRLSFGKISFLLVILLSLWITKKSIFLRWFGYGSYPTAITDEFTYVWQAISLKREGLPMAWTLNSGVYMDEKFEPRKGGVKGFGIEVNKETINLDRFKKDRRPLSAVKEIDYVKGKEQMLFVAPFFDHPPLGGMIYSLGIDKNIKEVEEVRPENFRKPALVMAVVTTGLLFIFLSLITKSPWAGLIGVVVYGTTPTYLLATRTAFLENAVPSFVLLSLISLFFYKKYFEKKFSYLFLIFAGLMAAMSVLAKEPALGFLLGSIVLLWKNKTRIKNIFIFLLGTGVPILAYFVWGLWLQGPLFIDILKENTSRAYFGAIKVITMLEALKFKDFPTDGWWIWGILSFILLSMNKRNKDLKFLTIPLFGHILLSLMLGSGNYPWYWISTIPFLAGCGAVQIWEIIKKPKTTTALLFFFIAFSSSYYWGREALGILPDINHYRMALSVFCLMLFLRLKFKNNLSKIIWSFFMFWMIYKIVRFNEVFVPYLIANWGNLSILSLPNY